MSVQSGGVEERDIFGCLSLSRMVMLSNVLYKYGTDCGLCPSACDKV